MIWDYTQFYQKYVWFPTYLPPSAEDISVSPDRLGQNRNVMWLWNTLDWVCRLFWIEVMTLLSKWLEYFHRGIALPCTVNSLGFFGEHTVGSSAYFIPLLSRIKILIHHLLSLLLPFLLLSLISFCTWGAPGPSVLKKTGTQPIVRKGPGIRPHSRKKPSAVTAWSQRNPWHVLFERAGDADSSTYHKQFLFETHSRSFSISSRLIAFSSILSNYK